MNIESKTYARHFGLEDEKINCEVCCGVTATVRHIKELSETFSTDYDSISNLISICTPCKTKYWGSKIYRTELQKIHNCKLKLYHDGL